MASRTTSKDITLACEWLNESLGLPQTAWLKDTTKTPATLEARIGHIYAEKGLNGYCLLQVVNVGGGVINFGSSQRVSAGEIYRTLQALRQLAHTVEKKSGKPFDWAA
jgi:hypothetical protein